MELTSDTVTWFSLNKIRWIPFRSFWIWSRASSVSLWAIMTKWMDLRWNLEGHHKRRCIREWSAATWSKSTLKCIPVSRRSCFCLSDSLQWTIWTAPTKVSIHFYNEILGGISSYSTVLLVVAYMNNFNLHKSPHLTPSRLLMGFLEFYCNHFDPKVYGVNTANGG